MGKPYQKQNKKPTPSLIYWGVGLLAAALSAAALVYYWRVFYSYGQYPFAHIPAPQLTALMCALAALCVVAAYLIKRFASSFAAKAAFAVLGAGLLFALVTPPFQIPDESQHFLRAYSLGSGYFDFDAERGYPADVDALCSSFAMAWTGSHDGSTIKARTQGEIENPVPADTVSGECISNSFVDYARLVEGGEATKAVTEPTLFLVLPLLPQALGVALAKLFGFKALGCLYFARVANLAFYALLCYFSLKNAKRYVPVLTAAMLMPLSLFMAASCSYDSMLLGLYFFAVSYYCMDEITTRDMWLFAVAVAIMTVVSGKYNNILWLALPFILPQKAWKTKLKKWQALALCVGVCAAFFGAVTLYNTLAIKNYGDIARMIEGVNQLEQLKFILAHFARTIAVFWGTLYENSFFLQSLGVFGNVDMPIAIINLLSPCVLLLGSALSVHEKSSLSKKSAVGLLAIAVLYAGAVMAGLYVTYTPVSMVRVIGLQARYFIPVFVMLFILTAALLSHVLEPNFRVKGDAKALLLSLSICTAFAVISAILIFQTYFVGPVTVLPIN
ncbi:MAG: DUF2142 domain-containing protein [Clostridia bacterium]|nr:DUF2142 domain-containing protein [Clostridia bacterium]